MAKMMTTPSKQTLSFFCGNDYLDSIQRSNLVSTLYISAGPINFPEKGWSDFQLILHWWLHELKEFRENNQAVAVLQFMDGSFKAEISRENASVVVKFYEDSKNVTPELAGVEWLEIDLQSTEENLINVARQVVKDAEAASVGDNKEITNIRIRLLETLDSLGRNTS
jgi:hypothetical protein